MSDTHILIIGMTFTILLVLFWFAYNVGKHFKKLNDRLDKVVKLFITQNNIAMNEVQQIFNKPEEITQEVKKIPILKHSAFKKNEIAR